MSSRGERGNTETETEMGDKMSSFQTEETETEAVGVAGELASKIFSIVKYQNFVLFPQ